MKSKKSTKKPSKKTIPVVEPDHCVFCRRKFRGDEDTVLHGSIETLENLSAHYFCVLFSANLSQRGKDSEGMKGFLLEDIEAELIRGRSILCRFCRKPGATIGCSIRSCQSVFHFPCGLSSGATLNFASGYFDAYCKKHHPFDQHLSFKADSTCSICSQMYGDTPNKAVISIACPSCKNIFHKNCLKECALKFGKHHYRCPICRDETRFVVHCQQNGIYVPDQDAAWELDENFNYEVSQKCAAYNCLCPCDRFHEDDSWKMSKCTTCGLNAAHTRCVGSIEQADYICADCIPSPSGQSDDGRSMNRWFYSKSNLHFKERFEEIVPLIEEANDDLIDVGSETLFKSEKSTRKRDSSFSDSDFSSIRSEDETSERIGSSPHQSQNEKHFGCAFVPQDGNVLPFRFRERLSKNSKRRSSRTRSALKLLQEDDFPSFEVPDSTDDSMAENLYS